MSERIKKEELLPFFEMLRAHLFLFRLEFSCELWPETITVERECIYTCIIPCTISPLQCMYTHRHIHYKLKRPVKLWFHHP
jgi:hypothetical protein